MLQTVEPESMLRYLFDESSEEERRQIEERYFADNEYFENLLKLEEDLIDEYNLDQPTSKNRTKGGEILVRKLGELPETRFAKEWIFRLVELKNVSPSDKYTPAEVRLYEREIKRLKTTIREQEIENLLSHAWTNRQLVSAMMDTDWLGLKLLTNIRSEAPMSASMLAAVIGEQIDVVVSALIRLVQFGAVQEAETCFSLTEKGENLLDGIDSTVTSRS
jgi:hypothetical protein